MANFVNFTEDQSRYLSNIGMNDAQIERLQLIYRAYPELYNNGDTLRLIPDSLQEINPDTNNPFTFDEIIDSINPENDLNNDSNNNDLNNNNNSNNDMDVVDEPNGGGKKKRTNKKRTNKKKKTSKKRTNKKKKTNKKMRV